VVSPESGKIVVLRYASTRLAAFVILILPWKEKNLVAVVKAPFSLFQVTVPEAIASGDYVNPEK